MDASSMRRIGVVGAGQMGRGIAQVAAAAGLDVMLCDATMALAEGGKAQIATALGKLVDKGKLPAGERDAVLGRIQAAEGVGGLSTADLAVEAATENLELKLGIFREVDKALPPGAILASNTSSISDHQARRGHLAARAA